MGSDVFRGDVDSCKVAIPAWLSSVEMAIIFGLFQVFPDGSEVLPNSVAGEDSFYIGVGEVPKYKSNAITAKRSPCELVPLDVAIEAGQAAALPVGGFIVVRAGAGA